MSDSDMTVQLSKETVDVLKKVYEVNQGLKFVEGEKVLKIKSTDNSLLVHAPIEEAIPRDFHIYNLKEFLSVLSIIDDPILDFSNDKYLEIRSDDGKQKLRYLESDPQFVTSYIDKEPAVNNPEIALDVSKEQFASVMKAAVSMGLDFVGFISDGETVSISAFNKNNGDKNVTNNFSIQLGESDTPFEMFYKIESQNISVLSGEGDLSFEVSSKKISKVQAESGKTYWIAMNASSKFGS